MEGWLFELGIHYSNIEEDFSNGYLLGSILYRYNLQDDFGTISTKENYTSSNLSKLQNSLERLGIKLNTKKVLNKETGYITKILGLIHKALHSISYSNLKSVRGKSAVTMKRASKLELIENSQKKFEEIRVKQSEKAFADEKKQLEAIRQSYLDERKKQIDILKSNKIFMQQWDLEGQKNWKKNQQRKTARTNHEENVTKKLFFEKTKKQNDYKAEHFSQVVDGIKEFERNMIRLGIDSVPDAKEIKKKKIDLKTESLVTMAKIIERKNINMQATKEREVRQRNLIIEQKKNEKFDKYKKGSLQLMNSLAKIVNQQYSIGWILVKKYSKKLNSFNNSLKNHEEILRKTEMK